MHLVGNRACNIAVEKASMVKGIPCYLVHALCARVSNLCSLCILGLQLLHSSAIDC